MLRKFALTAALALVFGTSARADFFDTSATINSPAAIANVNQILGSSSGGFLFNNTVGNPTGGVNAGDVRNFVSVGSDLLSNYSLAGGGNVAAKFAGQDIVKVVAVSGTTVTAAGGAVVNASITAGGVAYIAIPTGTYNQFNPLTFNITGANLLAKFSITTPQNIGQINQGVGGGIGAGAVNTIGINVLSPINAQGHFLLTEVPGGVPGTAFITPNTAGLPPGATLTGEGIHALINEQVIVGQTTDNTTTNAFRFVDPAFGGAAGLAALSNIAAQLGSAGGSFANAFGVGDGTGNSFNPYAGPSVTGTPGSGDFGTLFGNTEFPGVFAETVPPGRVPEPATLVTFGVIAAAGAFGLRRRKTA